ncbi:MAG: hypothetical protein ACFHU9_12500 [Fluviicola sp.]
MERVRLVVQTSDAKPFIEILKRSYPVDSTLRQLGSHYVFIAEANSLLFSGYQLNVNVIIEKVSDGLLIDINMTGGALGMFTLAGKTPHRESKRLANRIVTYCNNHNIQGHQEKGASTI